MLTVCLQQKHLEGQAREEDKLDVYVSLISFNIMGRHKNRVVIPPGRSWRIRTDPEKIQRDAQSRLWGSSRLQEGGH